MREGGWGIPEPRLFHGKLIFPRNPFGPLTAQPYAPESSALADLQGPQYDGYDLPHLLVPILISQQHSRVAILIYDLFKNPKNQYDNQTRQDSYGKSTQNIRWVMDPQIDTR
jgi:hypothetical protein